MLLLSGSRSNISEQKSLTMSNQSQMVRPEATWNPVTGCIEVSSGCRTCYAEREAESLRANKPNGVLFGCSFPYVQCHEDQMGVPLRWEKPHLITVSPLADLFHESVSFDFIAAIFGAMSVAKHHTFQVPTKRPKRMQAFFDWLPTKEYATVAEYLKTNEKPSNLTIRISAYTIGQKPPKFFGLPTSTVHAEGQAYGSTCPAPSQGGMCGDCRNCWNPAVENVSYHKH